MIKLRFPGDYIYVSSPFGMRTINGVKRMHNGVDLGWSSSHGGQNSPILAAADGTIETVVDGKNNDTSTNTYGNYIIINHGGGIKTLYGHLLKNSLLKKGTKVKRGQTIAKKNNSGYSFGSHCHFEVRINGDRKDPLLYTYADVNMVIAKDTSSKYKILKYDFSKEEPTPTPDPTYKFKMGDKVTINGPLYKSSDASEASGSVSNKVTNITRIAEGSKHPYNTTGDLGWMSESDIKLYSEPTPTPSTKLKVGDKVKIIAKGNGNSNGTGVTAGGIGWTRYVTKIYDGRKYPYQVGNKGSTASKDTTGFYKESALQKI